MSLEHQMEQHRLAVEFYQKEVKVFDESKKVFDEKVKVFDLSAANFNTKVAQFEETSEKFRLLANKYDSVLVIARGLIEEADKVVELGMIPFTLLLDLYKALDNGD